MDLRNYVGLVFSEILDDAAQQAKTILGQHPAVVEVLHHLISAEQTFLNALDAEDSAQAAPVVASAPESAQTPAQPAVDAIQTNPTGFGYLDSGPAGTVHAAMAAAGQLEDDSADPGAAPTEDAPSAPAGPMPGADHPVTGEVAKVLIPGADVPVTHVPAE
jgi:hypothetical protein